MLGRLGMVYDDVRQPHAAERRIGERAMPANVRESIDALRHAMEERLDAVASAQKARHLVSQEVLDGARAQLRHRIERLERRLRAAATSAETEAVRDLASIRAALVPQGERQERRLNFVPLMARHGAPFLAQLQAGAAMHAGTVIGTR